MAQPRQQTPATAETAVPGMRRQEDITMIRTDLLEEESLGKLNHDAALMLLRTIAPQVKALRAAAVAVCEDAVEGPVPGHSAVQDKLLSQLRKLV